MSADSPSNNQPADTSNPSTGNNNSNSHSAGSVVQPANTSPLSIQSNVSSSSHPSSLSSLATPSTVNLGPLHGALPNGIRITECTMKSASWPTDLILDLGKANWVEWSRKLDLLVCQCGLRPWLEGTIPCPDHTASPDAHYVWMQNDDALAAFMQDRVSSADIDNVLGYSCANDLFARLRTLHEHQGTYAQISLLIKAFDITLSYDKPLCDTFAEMRTYYRRIIAMGKIKDDNIFCAILLHSMRTNFARLQNSVQTLTQLPQFTQFNSDMIAKLILDEDYLIHRRQGTRPVCQFWLERFASSAIRLCRPDASPLYDTTPLLQLQKGWPPHRLLHCPWRKNGWSLHRRRSFSL